MKQKEDTGKDFAVGLGVCVTSTNAQVMHVHLKNISKILPKRGEFQVLCGLTLQGLTTPLITSPKFNMTMSVYKQKE